MEIKDIELTPPSKEAIKFFKKFIHEHDKGLKAIKTLEEIREIAKENVGYFPDGEMFARSEIEQIINKINEVIDE